MKKVFILSLVMSACGITGCAKDPTNVTFALNDIGEVSIHTDTQNAFLADNNFSNDLSNYANATQKNDSPKPIALAWNISSKAKKYIVEVSEKEEMTDSWSFESEETSFDLYNCKVNTTYYWRVKAEFKSTSFTSDVNSFKAKDKAVRNIYVDGVDNLRDIGGYATSDGKTVKQGMIYRSARFNDSDTDEVKLNITEDGLKVVQQQLGIKTDIDVRKNSACESNEIGGLTNSPLGEDVNYLNYPMYFEGKNIFEFPNAEKKEVNDQSIKNFFTALADEKNYPIVFHCTQGKDRTGALAYALEALLGVNENDMIHDYLFTNFTRLGSSYVKTSEVDSNSRIGGCIKNAEGTTIKEKAHNYLKSHGISEKTLNRVVELLTEQRK